jgi:hypothetical protein
MPEHEISSAEVARAAADAWKNAASPEAVLVFGETRVLLTRGNRTQHPDSSEGDSVPEYPIIDTELEDDSSSWLD